MFVITENIMKRPVHLVVLTVYLRTTNSIISMMNIIRITRI